MNAKDKISKETWMLFETSKDAVKSNIINAIKAGQLKVEATSLPFLLTLIDASLNEGYNKGHKNFMKTVQSVLTEASKPVVVGKAAAPGKKSG